jgi:hypothetical protein
LAIVFNILYYNNFNVQKETIMAKNIIQGKVDTQDNIVFTVHKVGASEEDILLQLDGAVTYQVVKLNVNDLPSEDTDKKKITWINNFGVMDSSGNYVENVHYTVFLPARAHASFIYHDKGGLKKNKTPIARGGKPERPGMVQVDFNTGDPGVGWK